ncbi:hypothetical protein [Herbaspirillum sp. RV1423]|uniref:hypothetical protein n=1 Tax=Herbaspirillum sp. RV1423 TaxID=1443993 RepID=UPI0012DD60C0|nr:hypothetical protein [Herbaspirillum sp. RV1423]
MTGLFQRWLIVIFSISLCACAYPERGYQVRGNSRFQYDDTQVAGWSMMSSEERVEYRAKMTSLPSYEECLSYINEHYKAMRNRAAEQGVTKPINRSDVCQRMRAAGMFN